MALTWAGLASNQCPDWDALQDAINTNYLISGGTAITGTTQSIYKTIGGATPLTSYVSINTAQTAYASRASNQSLWKSDFEPLLPYSFTIYYESPHANVQMFLTKSDACAHAGNFSLTVYCNTSSITTGSRLYTLSSGVYYPFEPYDQAGTAFWLYDVTGGKPFTMNANPSNTVASTSSCSITVTVFGKVSNTLAGYHLYWSTNGFTSASNLIATSPTTGGIQCGTFTVPLSTTVQYAYSNSDPFTSTTGTPLNIQVGSYPASYPTACSGNTVGYVARTVSTVDESDYFYINTTTGKPNSC